MHAQENVFQILSEIQNLLFTLLLQLLDGMVVYKIAKLHYE